MRLLRISALILALCLLAGCAGQPSSPSSADASSDSPGTSDTDKDSPAEARKQFAFTRETFPQLNGSTSTVPLGKAIAAVLLGETQEEVSDLIRFSKTTASYRQLMAGYADLLIAAEPAAVIWEEKATRGFEWEMSPFAVDGLVFVVNADNPVDSLTTEQVQKIYTGEITNWAQVGGDDLDIVPFQRNAEAGSQTAMLKLVMGDLPMMDAPAEYVRGEMGDLIEAVAAYDGTAAAIGYTVYYYANDMKMADGLKIIAIDGVEPCDETIRSGAYPFLNNYYTLIPAGLPEDAPAKILYDWLLSEHGQRLVAQQGYVSVLDVPGVLPTEEEADSSTVAAHWDALSHMQAKPLYSYYTPLPSDGLLQAGNDYGVLLKYVGTVSALTNYITDRLPLYGLVTADGRVVTEPVYASISFYGDNFLILTQGEVTGYRETEWGKEPIGGFRYTVAAADGNWVRDVGLVYEVCPLDENHLALSLTDGSVMVINADGTTAAEFPRTAFEPYLGKDFRWNWEGGPELTENNGILTIWEYRDENQPLDQTVCFLNMDTATVSDTPPEGWEPFVYDSTIPLPEPYLPRIPEYSYLEPVVDPITDTTYFYGYNREFRRYDLLDANCSLAFAGCNLYDLGAYENHILRAGLLATADENFFCYHSLETGEVVFRWPIRSNSD